MQSISLEYFQLEKSLNWHQLKNVNFQVSQISFYFFINNFFIHIIDKATQRMTSAGIMNFQISLLFSSKQVKVYKKWKVLTMENLHFGFVIWLCSCAVTVVVFVTEVMIWIGIRRVRRRFRRYIRYNWNKFPTIYPVKIQKLKNIFFRKIDKNGKK